MTGNLDYDFGGTYSTESEQRSSSSQNTALPTNSILTSGSSLTAAVASATIPGTAVATASSLTTQTAALTSPTHTNYTRIVHSVCALRTSVLVPPVACSSTSALSESTPQDQGIATNDNESASR